MIASTRIECEKAHFGGPFSFWQHQTDIEARVHHVQIIASHASRRARSPSVFSPSTSTYGAGPMPPQVPAWLLLLGPTLDADFRDDGQCRIARSALIRLDNVVLSLGLDQLAHHGLARLPFNGNPEARLHFEVVPSKRDPNAAEHGNAIGQTAHPGKVSSAFKPNESLL